MENILLLILNVARLSDCFLVIFDNFCMERTWIRELKSSFNMETIKMFRG